MIAFPEMLFRLSMALVLGGIVGFERERHVHTAGLRTNALVALGSALYMLISLYGFTAFLGLPHTQVDPSRVASYVVAGIGFLGGGAIAFHREHERVKGLTTAAAIWIVAALGLACGAGLVVEAITATLLALFVLIALRWAERALLTTSKPHAHRLQIEATAAAALLEEVTAVCSRLGIDLKRIEARTDRAEMRVEIVCQASTDTLLAQALSQIQALPGVQAVQADLDVLPRSREAEQ